MSSNTVTSGPANNAATPNTATPITATPITATPNTMVSEGPGPARPASTIEHRVARVLTAGTFAGVALLALGVAAMAAAGQQPVPAAGAAGVPLPDAAAWLSGLASRQPDAYIWLGLVVLIATPAARVAASLIGFARAGDRAMAIVAAAVLAVIAAGVAVGHLGG